MLHFVAHGTLRNVRHMSTLSIRLSGEIDTRLSEESRLAGQPKSLIAREALVQFLADRRRDRLLARFTRAAAAIDAAAALAIADEALPLDNESLDLADGGVPAAGLPPGSRES